MFTICKISVENKNLEILDNNILMKKLIEMSQNLKKMKNNIEESKSHINHSKRLQV